VYQDVSGVSLSERETWEAIVDKCSLKRIGIRLLSWITSRRVYSGIPLSWKVDVSAEDVLDTVCRLPQAIVVDRLHGLDVFRTAWAVGRGTHDKSDAESTDPPFIRRIHSLCTMISLRRVCRNVKDRGLVEPFWSGGHSISVNQFYTHK